MKEEENRHLTSQQYDRLRAAAAEAQSNAPVMQSSLLTLTSSPPGLALGLTMVAAPFSCGAFAAGVRQC